MQREDFFKVTQQNRIDRELTNKKEDSRNMKTTKESFCHAWHGNYMQ
jgi:hypothetical protein